MTGLELILKQNNLLIKIIRIYQQLVLENIRNGNITDIEKLDEIDALIEDFKFRFGIDFKEIIIH